MAVNARYLHRQQLDDGTIAAAVTMSQIVNVVTTVLLLIVPGVLAGSGFAGLRSCRTPRADRAPRHRGTSSSWWPCRRPVPS